SIRCSLGCRKRASLRRLEGEAGLKFVGNLPSVGDLEEKVYSALQVGDAELQSVSRVALQNGLVRFLRLHPEQGIDSSLLLGLNLRLKLLDTRLVESNLLRDGRRLELSEVLHPWSLSLAGKNSSPACQRNRR